MDKFAMTLCLGMILSLFAVAGCSDKLRTYSVEGTVTLDSEPFASANISFVVKAEGKGNTAYARTDENGFYRLQTHLGVPNAGTTPGEYRVTISKTVPVPTGQKELDSEGRYYDELEAKEVAQSIYTALESTPFSATVVKGKNTFNFDLKSKP